MRLLKIVSVTMIMFIFLFSGTGSSAQKLLNADDYVVGPGDVLEISVLEHEELDYQVVVGQDGKISFPLIGSIRVDGFTTTEIMETIEEMLDKDYLVNPEVTVFVKESRARVIYVYGEVIKPGSFSYTEDMSVIKAIAISGGVTKFGSVNNVKVLRWVQGKYESLTTNLNSTIRGSENSGDLALNPGDIVIVSG